MYFDKTMKTKVVKLDIAKIDSAAIQKAAGLVDAGKLVAFPTETVYGIACRVETGSLSRLDELKARHSEKYYTLHIGDKNDVRKYVPTVGLKGQKLIENGWPGPLTIVFELDDSDMNRQRDALAGEVFKNLYKDNSIGIRCPGNPIAALLLQSAKAAVVAPSANITGQEPAVNAEQVLGQLEGQIELLLDGGACKYKQSSTVVKINKTGLKILRPGTYSESELRAMTQVKFLFICTGNTCRSPMAERMFRKYLAEKSGCEVDRLNEKGYKVSSAGTMGIIDSPATIEAITACAAKGIDIENHKSSALSEKVIKDSDLIFAMTQAHRQWVVATDGEAANKCVLLAKGEEIPDPIGQSQHVYNECAEMIEKAIRQRISELVI